MGKAKPTGNEALFHAIKQRDIGQIQKLIDGGANPNAAQNSDYVGNFTALMCASSNQFLEAVKLLLKAGADVNAKRVAGRGDKGGGTALHDALSGDSFNSEDDAGASRERLQIVEILLKAGADANAVEQENRLPLWTAADSGYLKIVKCLVAAGASSSKWPTKCMPPLHGAANGCHFEVARFLVEHGAPVDGATLEGVTPLMAAAYRGCEKLVEFFLGRGAGVNHRSEDRRTPLISAALYAQDAYLEEEQELAIRLFKQLVEAGADLKAKNIKEETAIDIATRCENPAVANYLREALIPKSKRQKT